MDKTDIYHMSLGSSKPTRTHQFVVVLVTLVAVIGLAIAPGVTVAQDVADDDDPPPLPASYYGEVTVDGEPADGVEITAELNGEERGSITAEDGTYGGPGTLDEKLTVEAEDDAEVGDEITFFVDGEEATTFIDGEEQDTIEYEPGVNQELDLEVGESGTDDGAGAGGGGGGGGAVTDPDSASFEVSELDPVDVTVNQGATIDLSATITNTGDDDGTQIVEFRVGGDAVADQEVELAAGGDTTVEFTGIDTDELEGEFEHGVFTDDDSQTGTLIVERDDDDTVDDDDAVDDDAVDDDTDEGIPGFGAVVALVALIAAALLATRRR